MSTYQKPDSCANGLRNTINVLKWLIEKQAHMKFNIKAIEKTAAAKKANSQRKIFFSLCSLWQGPKLKHWPMAVHYGP